MKIGCWATNTYKCGESTALNRWHGLLRDAGHETVLFTTTKSGRRTQMIQADFDYKIIKESEVTEFIKQFDVILFYGLGAFEETVFSVPIYLTACMNAKVPYVMNCASAPSLKASAWNFARLYYSKGTYYLRDSLRSLVNLRYPFMAEKSSIVVPHPIEVPDNIKLNDGNALLFTARMDPVKRIHTLLNAEDTKNPWDMEIWSDPVGRHGFRYKEEYGQQLTSRLKGGYGSSDLDKVYSNGKWMIDLTTVKDEPGGGIQNAAIESMLRGVPVITAHGWSPWSSKVELPEDLKDLDGIRSVVNSAMSADDDFRDEVLQSGLDYIRTVHSMNGVDTFVKWIEEVIS